MKERVAGRALRVALCGVVAVVFAGALVGGLLFGQETPVSVAAFESRESEGGVLLQWTTATEANNIGFNLYAKTASGWIRINDDMIPSAVGDSAVPVSYSFRMEGLQASHFAIEDVDFRGASKRRGPFAAGRRYGSAVQMEEIDWNAVRAGRAADRKTALGKSVHDGPGWMASKKQESPEADLLISRTGLYRVSHEDLLAAGVDFSGFKTKDLALSSRGESVPMAVGGRAQFGPGSYLEFHGQAVQGSLYTDTAPYRLSVDRKAARRMASDPGRGAKKAQAADYYMEDLIVEKNRFYSFASPISDPWYDTRMLTLTQPAQFDFELQIDEYVAGAAPASLWVRLYGLSDLEAFPDHHLWVGLNGEWLLEDFSDGREERLLRVDLPAGLLREGANTLSFKLPADLGLPFDVMLVESYGVTYPRRFKARGGSLAFSSDASMIRVDGLDGSEVQVYRLDESGTTRVSDVKLSSGASGWSALFRGTGAPARYEVATVESLGKPEIRPARPEAPEVVATDPVDYLIISHSDFVDALSPLTEARAAQGLRVRVVAVEDLYERYSHGVVDPEAIRQYVKFAAQRLGARSVLLVGGDTYDYKNYTGAGSISFVPSLYAATGRSDQTSSGSAVQFAPVDPLYADVDGDNVPDLGIGRFPVRTVAELQTMIHKTLQYQDKAYGQTAVFAADNPDGELSFSRHSEEFISGMAGNWQVDRAYMETLGLEPARQMLMESINRGVALTSFVGHSSPTIWSFARLFKAADALTLQNSGRPTMVVQWGCWNNYYVLPSYDTLGHEFLLQEGGAAAVLGSSTQTQSASSESLGSLLAPWIAQPGMGIGEAMTRAKQELARANPEMLDVILGWTLLGDPSLAVSR